MTHLLVQQLRYARSEWSRGFDGVLPQDGSKVVAPMNALSWYMGRMAWYEQLYWLQRAQGKIVAPELAQFAHGKPVSAPPLYDVLPLWCAVTEAADPYLDTLNLGNLQTRLCVDGLPARDCVGTYLLRVIYNYYYHLGEVMSVRRMLDHTNLPIIVGEEISQSPYHVEEELAEVLTGIRSD